jgi:hypothetical protein
MRLGQGSGIARWVACALFALVAVSATRPAVAGKVYRCGNAFQDQPCATDKEAEARAATKPGTAREAPSTPSTPTRPATPSTSTQGADRLVLDAPRTVTIEARR